MLYHYLLEKYLIQLVVQKFLVMFELPDLLEFNGPLHEHKHRVGVQHFEVT
jgi:hypothetical protein